MPTTYFKTAGELDKTAFQIERTIKDRKCDPCTLACDCGESIGYRVRDEKGQTLELLILCPACYNDAPLKHRGE